MINKKYRTWIFLVITLVIAGWSAVLYFNIPRMGVKLSESNGKWVVTDVDRDGWVAREGIRLGDIVTHVDHQPVERKKLEERYGINSAKSITVMRAGQPFVFDFSDMSDRPIKWNQSLIPMVLFILMLTFSSLIAYKKPYDDSASFLILFLMSVAVAYLAAYGNTIGDTVSTIVFELALTFAPVWFLHFVRSYFCTKGIASVHKRVVTIGYVTVVAWNIFYFLFVLVSSHDRTTQYYIDNLGLIIFITGTLIALLVQVRMYIRYRNSSQQALMSYMMIGNITSFFPFIALTLLPLLLVGESILNGGVAVLSFVFLPLTYLYLIVSRQMFDIEFMLSRLRYFCIIALLPTLLILLGSGLILVDEAPHPMRWIQLFLIIYGSTVLFLYAKEVLDRKFRNKVIKGAYRFEQSLESFSRQVSEVMKVNELEQCLQKELLNLLPIGAVGFIERHNETKAMSVKRSHGKVPVEEIIPQLNQLAGLSIGEPLKLTKGICYLIGHGRLTQHFIWIGDKDNHTEFNHDEIMWLRNIMTYVSFVYQNLQLIEGLVHDLDLQKAEAPPWVIRLLFRLSEQERRKLASDLHDSALQDQLLWYRKLETIVNDEAALPAEARSSLNEISEGLLDVVHQIRETCNELRPPFLQEMGAVEAIENLCAHAQLNANFAITFNHENFRVELDDEYVLTIYRITQELLRNGMKHSKATHVELLLYSEDHHIHYRYKDNGIGIEMDGLKLSFDHMGLSGIRERVSGLEGETLLLTAPGEGLQIDIILPLPSEDKVRYREREGEIDNKRSAS